MTTNHLNPAHFHTTNSNYGQGWQIHDSLQQVDLKKAVVPTYAEVVKNMQVIHASYIL